jgi:hypothetical protein
VRNIFFQGIERATMEHLTCRSGHFIVPSSYLAP